MTTPRRGSIVDNAYAVALSALLAMVALGPIVLQLLHRRVEGDVVLARSAGYAADLSAYTRWGTIAALILIVLALLRPGRALRSSQWPLAGAVVLWAAASVANTQLGARTGPAEYPIFAFVVLTAIALLRPSADLVVPQLRFWLGVYVYGSLLALLVDHDWAAIPLPDGIGEPTGQPRLWGISEHPNHLAPLAALFLVVELTTRGRRVRMAVNALAGAVVVLLTGTVTAVAALLLIAGLLGVGIAKRSGRRVSGAAAAGAVAVTAVLVVGMMAALRPEFGSVWHVLLTADGRTMIWSATFHVWRDHPLLGYGPYVFDHQAQLQYLGPKRTNIDSAHNQYLQAFAQGGLLLGTVLAVYVAAIVTSARRGATTPDGMRRTAAATLLLVTMATEVVLRVAPNSSFFVFHVAVLLLLFARPDSTTSSHRATR